MDYAQNVHKFKAGLPSLIGKNNFMLAEISRTSKEIFEYASKFMNTNNNSNKCIQDAPKLAHDFSSGKKVNVIHCDQPMLTETLSQILGNLELKGKNTGDVAILTGKKKDANKVANDILPQIDKADLTVDSVKRFSGLSRSVIIGLNPDINDNHGDINKFIVNLATRAQDNLVIITTNSDLVKKLQNLVMEDVIQLTKEFHPNLSATQMSLLMSKYDEIGVKNVETLKYLSAEDISDIMKIIHDRKFVLDIRRKIDRNDECQAGKRPTEYLRREAIRIVVDSIREEKKKLTSRDMHIIASKFVDKFKDALGDNVLGKIIGSYLIKYRRTL
ncbi:hypothetical protein LOTGIDRAFT_155662 [Lottia gigantea]|uniref:Uncharacterized protein n=1 Tax=Lottia gigantea TaxID=225164 RepID=V4B2J6_LOTGI|nr:hypothetical protein LOTGIDRAFT_155662 [Lottia gigantea]ESO82649.1 hypothetical protein LOTGIDRAFT_155662 [Lottia gigantea]